MSLGMWRLAFAFVITLPCALVNELSVVIHRLLIFTLTA